MGYLPFMSASEQCQSTECYIGFGDIVRDLRAVELLDKLDGIRLNKRKELAPQRMEDYLQLPDDYESRTSQPGKKRVWELFSVCLYLLLNLLYSTIHLWKLSGHCSNCTENTIFSFVGINVLFH